MISPLSAADASAKRILEVLEERYPEFPGLNLTWEVREGIIKHRPDTDASAPEEYSPGEPPTLEAQLVGEGADKRTLA